ncbi:DNA gyrase inhibitor YacG [Pontivivens insulae]|uniref:DNA gyrase inhibitor YacG n=1 Tax=Pontivivens insulae TaxID=1639689 RepID=A0A2R8ABN0_9RHOB|nr:DNA gyrase inhibitor YacG [Pontivivens insulae]RED11193.1 hypothetical protein DFR53_3224 [Pontivivens insulae]SPF29634.1 DNA gyrase inhibitor YacG [Pontivivens insulae]
MSCPICSAASAKSYRPFCSKHCADVDLARWFNGAYAVPAEEEDQPDEVEIRPAFRGDDDV